MKIKSLKSALLIATISLSIAGGAFAQTRSADTENEPQRASATRTTSSAPVRASAAKSEPATTAAAMRSSETQSALAANVKNLSVNPATLEKHEMRPANVVGVISDEGLDENEPVAPVRALIAKSRQSLQGAAKATIAADIAAMPKDAGAIGSITSGKVKPGVAIPGQIGEVATAPGPYLDVNGFGEAFHAAIKDNVAGYALRIGKNGQTIYTLQWNWAQTPNDSSLGWNPQRRMHIASVSKLMTGIAMVRLLNEKGISYDAKIANYLPTYWQKGPNVNNMTFRQLLTHRSGFSTGGSSSDFQFMKARVAAGVPATGGYDYENMNFGLCRILISVINGNINKNAQFTPLVNDLLWDAITINAYEQYVKDKVFTPAGVSGPTLDKPGSPARAYPWPVAGGGWNSGNLASMAGGAGWHMSINEVLAVMHTYRRTNKIVQPSVAQDALDAGLGVDRIINTPAGKLYDKNGRWRDGGQRTEQSVATFMPDGMDIVVFTNSPIGANAASLRSLVSDLYLANVKNP